ncbi:MAG: DUF2147 domain-containing protein [Burkholderiales bacterium]
MKHWLLAVGFLWSVMAGASQSPEGLWRTIDDETGKERSFIRVSVVNGELQGVVEKIIDRPGDDPAHLCKKCEGDRKDKPVIGMAILWGLKKKSDSEYAGGQIMDPNNGKTYRCKLKLIEQGKKLEVRGYIGVSLIGRSQVWLRED